MKKIAFLLAALSVASVSYAKEILPEAEPVVEEVVVEETAQEVKSAPVLRVTSIGQYLEIDNTSGAEDIGEGVHFGNSVGLALGDNWTFDLMARKTWSASTDDWKDADGLHSDGMKSNGHRIDIQATRHFENFSVGLKWRGEQDMDKFYIPVSYNFGMISGWATPAYSFMNEGNDDDAWYLEAMPLTVKYGPVALGYYFEGTKSTGDDEATPAYSFMNEGNDDDAWYLEAMPLTVKYGPVALGYYFEGTKSTGDDDNHEYDHQVRLMLDVYKTDRFTIGAEYWYQFAYENQTEKAGKLVDYYENNKHTGVIKAAYDVTENLTVDGYYRYDFNKYDEFDGATKATGKADDYYGEFYVGWTYKF